MQQTLAELNERFAIRDHVTFHEDEPGMPKIRIAVPASEATIYLQGAHLTQWTPIGGSPVLYLSPKSTLLPGKPIRGGVPVLFPWFGDRWNASDFAVKSPSHGFARTALWTLDRTHLDPTGDVHVTLSLAPDDTSRSLGYDHFAATIDFRIGKELRVALTVTNRGTAPMEFEEGLHTYFAVDDAATVLLDGLRGSTYLDKRDEMIRKVQRESQFRFTRDVDQVHVHTAEPLTLHDASREIHIDKEGSQTTVIWNPWTVLTPGLPDLPEDGWKHFVCVEAVNASDDRITLSAGATHGMSMTVSVA